ncbi:MAG: hypothetical protein LIP12_08165 [Clostridiales bacterium]|nr:hypothetical protein [Clostridiales bacterium]
MKRNIDIIRDVNDNQIVVINDIRFKGRQNINWDDVEKYVRQYIGKFVAIASSNDIVYMGSDLPDEFSGSKYTEKLKGALAKAKANAAQGLPELVEIAVNKRFKKNFAEKHRKNAKYGWYRYDTRFALPICDEYGEVHRYNVFQAEIVIRHAENGKLYLYDIINIRKETKYPA